MSGTDDTGPQGPGAFGGAATIRELRAEALTAGPAGRPALSGVSIIARSGEPVALTGPSGAGKTALLLVLAGLLVPRGGRISWSDAHAEHRGPPPGAVVGLVLQSQGLVPELTAQENVALPLQARGLAREEVRARSLAALGEVGLGATGDRVVDQLSGGQRQRTAVARALGGTPAVVLADEPTAELDADNRARVLTLLTASPAVVVIASNDPEVIEVCAHVLELRDGRDVTVG